MVSTLPLGQLMNILQNASLMEKLNLTANETEWLERLARNYSEERRQSCGCEVYVVTQYAKYYHGYFAIFVCLFGTVANMLNIAVLTRKEMAAASINRILMGLAVADMLVMIEYVPFAYYYHVELPGKMNFPYAGAVFMLFHVHFTQVLHTISICLTLTLAIWRYLAIG